MKHYFYLIVFISAFCKAQDNTTQVNTLLDRWHKDAAETKFDDYFAKMTDDAVFIGTDATENWDKKEFMAYAKPYFDKGKAWSFTALERHIYFSKDNEFAWFDELLNTQMKICRGSGVLVKQNGVWKIQHYVLSMTIPNDTVTDVIKIKSPEEDPLIKELKDKK